MIGMRERLRSRWRQPESEATCRARGAGREGRRVGEEVGRVRQGRGKGGGGSAGLGCWVVAGGGGRRPVDVVLGLGMRPLPCSSSELVGTVMIRACRILVERACMLMQRASSQAGPPWRRRPTPTTAPTDHPTCTAPWRDACAHTLCAFRPLPARPTCPRSSLTHPPARPPTHLHAEGRCRLSHLLARRLPQQRHGRLADGRQPHRHQGGCMCGRGGSGGSSEWRVLLDKGPQRWPDKQA